MQLEDVLEALDDVRVRGGYYQARCPAHDDRRASLQVSERDDHSIGLYCHAGCSFVEVVAALGVPMSALMGEQEEVVYTYSDEHGRPLYDVIRQPGKEFPVRRYVGGATEWGLGETRRVLYRLPELLAADQNRWVFVPEGEKDVDAIRSAGGVATCNPGGAGKWDDSYSDYLAGRHVQVIADKDEAGRKHASDVLLSLRKKAVEVRLVESRSGKDAFDHLAAGYDLESFVEPSHFKPLDFTRKAPQVDWLLEGYLARGDLALLAGKPKLGKSWFTMALATAISNGADYFLGVPIKNGKVLYFDEENPEDVVYSRMLHSLGHRKWENLRYVSGGGLRLDTHPELLMQETILYQPILVVIDSLARVHAKEENSFVEMSTILNGILKPLARETGATVLLIHHHDKAGHGPRGSGDIEAAVDTILNLRGEPGAGSFVMSMQGRRRRSAGEWVPIRIVDIPGAGTRLETE